MSRSLVPRRQVKWLPFLVCTVVLCICRGGLAQIPAKSDAQVSFDALKSLAGTWSGSVTTDPPNSEIDGTIEVTMRVASRGSVVVHEIAPGGVPEPTLMFVEGDRLTLVHYCEAGNRPRMAARKSADPKRVEFDFVDLSGRAEPAFLHHLLFTLVNADRHTEDWTFRLPGEKELHAHFDLKRARASHPRRPKDDGGPR